MLKWLKVLIWFPLVTLLYPILSLPMMLPMMLIRPLQLVAVLVVTGARVISLPLAVALAVVLTLYYSWTVFVPPHDATGYAQWQMNRAPDFFGKLSQVVFMAVILGVFLYLMQLFTFNPMLKWFASFGLAYYVAGVAMGVASLPTLIAQELLLGRLAKEEV